MKIKVLHIIPDKDIGIAGQQMLALHKNMNEDFRVLVPVGSQLKQFFEDNSLPCTTYAEMSDVKKATKLVEPDIVHTHTSHELRILAHKMNNIKTVHTQHSAMSVKFFSKLLSRRLSHAVIATTKEARESLFQMGTSMQKIRMIYNCVAAVEQCDDESRVRQQLNIPSDTFTVTCFASFSTQTKIENVLSAAKELPYNVIMLVAGVADEYRTVLESRVRDENLQNVRILGEIYNINDVMSITNVQIIFDASCHQLLFSGMSVGKPTIATSDFDYYIVQDKVNGLIIPGFGAEELDDAITRLKGDPQLYKDLSAGALSRYNNRFSVQRMAREIEEVYLGIMKA